MPKVKLLLAYLWQWAKVEFKVSMENSIDFKAAPGNFAVFIVVLAMFSFAPYFLYTYGIISSLGISFTIVSAASILIVIAFSRVKSKAINSTSIGLPIFIAFLITLHRLIAIGPDEIIGERFFSSLIGIFIVIFASAACYRHIFGVSASELKATSLSLTFAFAIFGALSLADIPLGQSTDFAKAVGPYSEPSHFALVAAPWLFLSALLIRNQIGKASLLLGFGIYGIVEQSLVTLLVVILIGAITLRLWVQIPLVLTSILLIGAIDLSYFSSRLAIREDSQNLSVLVFLQGFDFIKSSLEMTSWMGLGFQQLGFVQLYSPIAEVIKYQSGQYLNYNDGSFVASKLISEFGIFGIILCAYLTLNSIYIFAKYRKKIRDPQFDSGMKMAFAICVFYNFELWVRGLGYFSFGTVFFIMALLYIRRFEKMSAASVESSEGSNYSVRSTRMVKQA